MASWHLAAILNALTTGHDRSAKELLAGLAERVDTYMHNPDPALGNDPSWGGDLAHYLLRAACAGLPLKSSEARIIQEHYAGAADALAQWPYWDLWDASVSDGTLPYAPGNQGHGISVENFAYFLEYCFSPFRNESGAKVFDCDIVKDLSKWGK